MKEPSSNTVRYIFFDFEEIFFLGSYEFAKRASKRSFPWQHKEEADMGLVALEMLGWSQKKLLAKAYTRKIDHPSYSRDFVIFNRLDLANKDLKDRLEISLLANGFNRSDNWSFWQFGIPAIALSQDWENDFNPHYHTVNDTWEKLNLTYMRKIIKALGQMVKVGDEPRIKKEEKSEDKK